MSALEVFKEFFPQLADCLSKEYPIFYAKLVQSGLISQPSTSDTAESILYTAIKSALDSDDTAPFEKLLVVMEECDSMQLNELATSIRQRLQDGAGGGAAADDTLSGKKPCVFSYHL